MPAIGCVGIKGGCVDMDASYVRAAERCAVSAWAVRAAWAVIRTSGSQFVGQRGLARTRRAGYDNQRRSSHSADLT